MALTAYNSAGFELSYNKAGFPHNPIAYTGTTGVTYTLGSPVVMSAGKLLEWANAAGPTASLPVVGIVAETKTCAADDDQVKVVPTDGNVFTVTFVDHVDKPCVPTSTGANKFNIAQSSSLNTSTTAIAGALIYIYNGPGKGDLRTVVDNTTGSSTSATQLTVAPAFSATPTTVSEAIILCSYTTGVWDHPKNIGSFMKRSSDSARKVSTIVSNASTMSAFAVQAVYPKDLKMDVVVSPPKTIFGLVTTG